MIKKIVFIGDLLRIQKNGYFFSDRSLGWEYYLFKRQLEIATGLEVTVAYAKDKCLFDRDIFFELCNMKSSTENWIKIACGNYTKKAIDYFKECFQDTLLITQVAGSLKCVMEEAQIPYIDIYVSAFKFLDDLRLAFRSNIKEINEKLIQYVIDDDLLFFEANKIRSFYWSRPHLHLAKNSLLLCGQSDIDLSLVKDNKLVSFLDYKEKIKELLSQYPKVYYKPHPEASANNDNEIFIRSFPNIEIVYHNFYRMMCTDDIVCVAALSSGTLKEAPYFDKKIYTLSHPFINYYKKDKPYVKDDFIVCDKQYMSVNFWSQILSPIIPVNKINKDKIMISYPNFLRETLNGWWSQEFNREDHFSIIKSFHKLNLLEKKIYSLNDRYDERNYLDRLFKI